MENALFIEKIFDGSKRLPTLPTIAMKILETVKNEKSGISEIGEIISTDPPLSAEILRVINSPYFGVRRKVTSVTHAVSMLGTSTVKNLALSFSVVKNYQSNGKRNFDHNRFWKASIISAVSAKILSEYTEINGSDDIFFLGLLHDIGRLAMAHELTDQYGLVIEKVCNEDCPVAIAEELVFGFNHMNVGKFLAEKWELPEEFYKPIGVHHMPESVENETNEVKKRSVILYLSELFVNLFETEDPRLLNLMKSEINKFGIFENIDVESVTETIFEKAQVLFPLFEIEVDKNTDYSNLLLSAREELVKNSVNFINDFFKQQLLLKNLQVMVNLDSMTQLVNYRHFFEILDKETYRAKRYDTPLSLLIADIDNFKNVNDNYGHPAGDLVIKSVANCLKSSLRESDVAARYGGEEFAVILPHTDQEAALAVAERLRQSIANNKIDDENLDISVTASFGVTTLNGKNDFPAQILVEQADQALYQAKRQGRNRSCKYE